MDAQELHEILARHTEWLACGKVIGDARWANLSWANLSWANLSGAKDGHIARLDFGGWSICVRSTETTIGCQRRANADWLAWAPDSPEVAAMHADATEWWRVHGEAVKACIRCVMERSSAEVRR